MQNCPQCGAKVSSTASYCEHCGTALSTDDAAEELIACIRNLVAEDQKIEAIRILRASLSVDLVEAKRLVESEAALVERLRQSPAPGADSSSDQEILDLLQSGQKIEAIKRHRERTGAGLKEAKDYVESLAARHGIIARPAGCLGLVLLAISLTFVTVFAVCHPVFSS